MDEELIFELYINQKLSTTDIGKELEVSYSTIRRLLLKNNLLRSRSEGHLLAHHKMGLQSKGKKRIFTPLWKENMRLASIKRWEKTAKGICLKPSGYYEITRGMNKGRMLHDVIMELHIGRKLKPDEIVHHINEKRNDNEITNLHLLSKSEHCSLHAKKNYLKRKINKKGQFV